MIHQGAGKYVAVYIGGYQHNAVGTSLYAAVSKAMDFFAAAHWRGPKWNAGTVFQVCSMYGEERKFKVLAGDVLRWREAAMVPRGETSDRRSSREAAD